MYITRRTRTVIAVMVAAAAVTGGVATAVIAHSDATADAMPAAAVPADAAAPADAAEAEKTDTADSATQPAAPAAPKPAGTAVAKPSKKASIPDSAMLQAEDLGGTPEPGDPQYRPELKPPMPCGPAAHRASSRKMVAEREIMALTNLHGGESPDVVWENVALYKGNGATLYYQELRAGIRNCSTERATWRVVSTHGYGDRSMVIRLAEAREDYGGQPYEHETYFGVAQVGDVVATVVDLGWETSGGQADVARELLPLAVARAETL